MSETVAIIINYNSADFVRKCVASLASQPIDRFLVLDNSSTINQREILNAVVAADSRVAISYEESNLGFGAGVNRAVEMASARPEDILWILNPDIEVLAGAVSEMRAALDSGGDIVSPLIYNGHSRDPDALWFAGGSVDLSSGEVRHWTTVRTPRSEGEIAFETEFVTGAAPMLKASTWIALGGFRPDLFMYWEDVDWSVRAKEAGLRMVVAPRARTVHTVGASSGFGDEKSELYYYYMQRNRLIVSGNHGVPLVRLLAGSGKRETLRLLLRPAIRERRGRVKKTIASVSGIVAGFRSARSDSRAQTRANR
jgi:N-acetylglucosaminyl-diphospho-decaprenol L-rhamnosyltransferase